MRRNKGHMDRRDFLKTSIIGGAATMAGIGKADEGRAIRPFELEEATIADLQRSMASGAETPSSLTRKYLERIREIDDSGPQLNSVIEINPDAMAIAEKRDRERTPGNPLGPLHGIPILIKDNINTGDRMATSAGSLALAENHALKDAPIVAKLREAGAIILGKTNLSEWANFRSTKSSSGWSGRGGQTRNPYALDRNPCGSSSGSGAAASANLCVVAVGTETDGSIVCPSTTNGLVGIKPSLGLVSGSGIVPISHSQDTAGPMARTVRDAAILLGALTTSNLGPVNSNYTQFLNPKGLKGARIGVARKFFGFNPKVDAIMEEALKTMKRLGAVIIDPADLPSHGQYDDTEFEVLLYEFKADLNKYLKSMRKEVPYRTLKQLIDFNSKNRDHEMPFFGQEIFDLAQAKGPLSEKKYKDALAKNHRLSRKEGIDAVIGKHRLSAIVAPTGGPAWTTDLLNGDHFTGGSSTPAAVSGYPAITVPAGTVRGLPVGITFFGALLSEPTLLKLAYAFEQETRVRKAPTFRATAT